ncbi:hypothetical protein NQ317_003235 [Molorchus minor]|uniref:Uncharacterized protein n=1 Tax=Molorchus minor TaxID=1323400 RepID=A0ABQ9JEI1_9CUCU|nr:hypothetical protein NQ317_003235 [Molorchus minor]
MLFNYLWIFRRIDGKLFYFSKTQIKVYEDWPHHLLLKTCYRTSANLSDGSVWSQPAYRFMFIHGCIHANSTLIELVFRNICRIGSRDISKCSDKNLIQILLPLSASQQ